MNKLWLNMEDLNKHVNGTVEVLTLDEFGDIETEESATYIIEWLTHYCMATQEPLTDLVLVEQDTKDWMPLATCKQPFGFLAFLDKDHVDQYLLERSAMLMKEQYSIG